MKDQNAMEIAFRKAVEDGTKKDKDFIKDKLFGAKKDIKNKKNKIEKD